MNGRNLSCTYDIDTLVPGDTNLCGLGPEIDTNDTHGRGSHNKYEATTVSGRITLGKLQMLARGTLVTKSGEQWALDE